MRGKVFAGQERMRRFTNEDAPTTEWAKREGVHTETPLGGVELAALRPNDSAAWDETFAVRLPVEPEGPSRAVAMGIAALLSFVIGLGTFLFVMKIQAQAAATQAPPQAAMSLGAAPLVEEGIPIPPPDPWVADVVAPAAASPIVPYTSGPRPPHAAPAPTVRKGKKGH